MPLANLTTPQMKEFVSFCKRFDLVPLEVQSKSCRFQTKNGTIGSYRYSVAGEVQKAAGHYRWEWHRICDHDLPKNLFSVVVLRGKPDKGNRYEERFFLAPVALFVEHDICKKASLNAVNSGGWGKASFLWDPQYSFDESQLRNKLQTL